MHGSTDRLTPEELDADAETLETAAARYTAQETPDGLHAAAVAAEEAKAKRASATYQREMGA